MDDLFTFCGLLCSGVVCVCMFVEFGLLRVRFEWCVGYLIVL